MTRDEADRLFWALTGYIIVLSALVSLIVGMITLAVTGP